MSSVTPRPERPATPGGPASLTDRVRERVQLTTRALDRRAGASQPRLRRRTAGRPAPASSDAQAKEPVTRESRALRRVFRDLGETHKMYRRRTGQPVTPGLRAAVDAFKAQPTLASLVPVAGYLDELGLLAW